MSPVVALVALVALRGYRVVKTDYLGLKYMWNNNLRLLLLLLLLGSIVYLLYDADDWLYTMRCFSIPKLKYRDDDVTKVMNEMEPK